MKYEIIGGQLPAVVCKLDRGEKMFTESGGMCWMEEGFSMDSNTRGGLLKERRSLFRKTPFLLQRTV